MNEKQARKENLQFTGMYESFYERELVIAEAARIRKLGFRAVVVNGQNGGSSVYAAPEYFQAMAIHQKWQQAVQGIPTVEARIQELLKEIEDKKQRLEEFRHIAAQPEPLKVERW